MRRRRAMTPLAGDPSVSKDRRRILILRAGDRWLRPTGMARQAGRHSRKVQRHFARVLIRRSHVPSRSFLRIQIDGRLKEKIVVRKKIRLAPMTRANEVQELSFAVQRIFPIAIKTEPGVAIFQIHAIVHARGVVLKFSRREILRGGAAGSRHRCRGIRRKNFRVTLGASVAARRRSSGSSLR